jgi:hypothetical protein
MNKSGGDLEILERFLNSDWAFGLTQKGGLRRRRILILLAGFAWGAWAYLNHLPDQDVFATLNLFLYPFQAIFEIKVFVVLVVALACFQLILIIALFMFGRSLNRVRYWMPSILIFILFCLRIFWAPYLYPPQWNLQLGFDFLLYFAQALLSPASMRIVIIAAVGFWIAYYTAAVYLDDIYELQDVAVARRFVLQATLGSQYNFMAVRGGEVPLEYKKSPIFRVGGPGLVRVHLDNAALFETINGKPHVIGPTVEKAGNVEALNGFERLRSIIDLCDQMDEYTVEGRTRDGIRIQLKNVNLVFSIYRDGQDATLSRPYPFDPISIQRLVYAQGQTSWVTATSSLIRRRFGEFIANHTLSEFLAAVGVPELQQAQEDDAGLQQMLNQLAGIQSPTVNQTSGTPTNFLSRPDIMTELFTAGFQREAARRGVEIKWIGGGTWELPDAIVPQRHLEAWKLSRENLLRGSPTALEKVGQESQMTEFARIVQDVPIHTYTTTMELDPFEALRNLIIAYQRLLNEAYDDYQRQSQDPAQQEWLRQVLVFLSRFSARWLGGP